MLFPAASHPTVAASLLLWAAGLLACANDGQAVRPRTRPAAAAKDSPGTPAPAATPPRPLYQGKPASHWRRELEESFGLMSIKPDVPLGRNGDPKALPVLLELLDDSDPMIRCKAARSGGAKKVSAGSARAGAAHDAEPEEAVALVGLAAAPEGRTAVRGVVEPGPAALDAPGAPVRAARVLARARAVVVLVVPVAAPLPDVAVHVVQP